MSSPPQGTGANLDQALLNISALMVTITASPQPDYSVDGKSLSKGQYLRQLTDAYNEILVMRQRADGPFEVRSRGVS